MLVKLNDFYGGGDHLYLNTKNRLVRVYVNDSLKVKIGEGDEAVNSISFGTMEEAQLKAAEWVEAINKGISEC